MGTIPPMSNAKPLPAMGTATPPRRQHSAKAVLKADQAIPTATTKKISPQRKPAHMTVNEWQIALRRQMGRAAPFHLKNIGQESIFSEFHVTNPEGGHTYRVAIRGRHPGENFCSCPDHAINGLGTCKHIEFVLGKLTRTRAGKTALAKGYHPPFSEVYVRYGVTRDVAFKEGTSCTPELRALAKRYFDQHGILRPEAISEFPSFIHAIGHDDTNVLVYEDAITCVAQARDKARLGERITAMFPQGPSSPRFTSLLNVPLYPYQREGALFAARAGRCLIADDMGLGKTIQAVAAAEILAHAAGVDHVLIVAPTSLKYQWKEEIEKFTTRSVEVIEGLRSGRALSYAKSSFFKITNYDVIHTDLDLIQAWAPDLVILDEAQRIKNWKTRTAQTIKRVQSDYAIVLTGTPLENRLEELHSIVEFVDRFHLGPRYRFLAEHQHVDESGRVIGYRNLSKIADTLKSIVIRRTKADVLPQLPARTDTRLFVPMTEEQRLHHEEQREIVSRIVAKWRRLGFLSERDQRGLMIALQNMRMVCNSTYLLDPTTDFGLKVDELMLLLDDLLEQPDAKVVIFSQWVRTHELLAKRLKARHQNFVVFHGGVESRKRSALVRTFKQDPTCRIFLATDAGGVGLNLQQATAVIIMDQPWNPAVLEQRIGRVHRLGQHRPVQVYHFIAEQSIEHGMLALLSFKKSLFSGVLDSGQDEIFLDSTRLKRFMDSVETATSESHSTPGERGVKTERVDAGAMERASAKSVKTDPQVDSPALDNEIVTGLLSAGRSLLDGIEHALNARTTGSDHKTGTRTGRHTFIEQDRDTGETFLKFPLPSGETLQKIALILTSLTK